ncbi:MAG: polysaccharide biosynthesis protein, partial [Desulfuromusa sp.]|nr:polysaccharide biosynthesis protein [Desulfuromusa sp.]
MSRIEEALKKAASQRKSPLEKIAEPVPPKRSRSTLERNRSVTNKLGALLDVVPMKISNLMLATAREEKTAVVEEYNKLRSSIIALTKGEKFLNTILVTSTISEEGKSMTALNLAISLAKEHDHTVLLVDADLRRPSVHKYLEISPEVGLVHCL